MVFGQSKARVTATHNQNMTVAADTDGGEEELAASVVAGGDPAPVLEASEEVLDPVTLLVERSVVAGRILAPTPGRGCRRQSPCHQGLRGTNRHRSPCRPGSIFAGGQGIQQDQRALRIAHLAGRQEEGQRGRPSPSHTMCSLEFSPPFGPFRWPAGASPFLRALAAVRCALSPGGLWVSCRS